MRVFVPVMIVLAVLYCWDVEYNRSVVSDGLINMGRSISNSISR
jgi:hypothetical protein